MKIRIPIVVLKFTMVTVARSEHILGRRRHANYCGEVRVAHYSARNAADCCRRLAWAHRRRLIVVGVPHVLILNQVVY